MLLRGNTAGAEAGRGARRRARRRRSRREAAALMTAVLLAPGILGSAAPMAVNPAGLRLSVAPGPGPSFRLAAECAAPEYARRYVSNWAGIFVKDFAAKSRDLQTAGQAAGSVF